LPKRRKEMTIIPHITMIDALTYKTNIFSIVDNHRVTNLQRSAKSQYKLSHAPRMITYIDKDMYCHEGIPIFKPVMSITSK
jgi:hypothetical protein